MDAIDIRILDILQKNGRATQTEIAKTVNLSAPSVSERLRKLENRGIIRKYVALLDPEKLGRKIAAFIMVWLDKPQHSQNFLNRIREMEEIMECYHVTGKCDYILKVRTSSTKTLETKVLAELRSLDGVQRTETAVFLSAAKEETFLGLSELQEI
jgi:Lrp/AsnC family transcriptional regulator, leucine-responsive regulatory protein